MIQRAEPGGNETGKGTAKDCSLTSNLMAFYSLEFDASRRHIWGPTAAPPVQPPPLPHKVCCVTVVDEMKTEARARAALPLISFR